MPRLQRVPAASAIDRDLRCSFCDKEPAEASELIAGGGVCICDECLARCHEMAGGDERTAAADAGDMESEERTLDRRGTYFRLLACSRSHRRHDMSGAPDFHPTGA
jgi:ClpX C4-type zinc finger